MSGSHAEWPSLFLFNVDAESVLFFYCFFVLLLGKYLCCIVVFIFIYYLLTYLVFLNLQKIAKKKVSHKCDLLFYFAFWYGLSNFDIIFIHTRVKFCTLIICVICFNN